MAWSPTRKPLPQRGRAALLQVGQAPADPVMALTKYRGISITLQFVLSHQDSTRLVILILHLKKALQEYASH